MVIEFDAPVGEVQEWVIDDLKQKLTDLHKLDKDIVRAGVHFRKFPLAFNGDYVCEITLTIFGSSIMFSDHADSYLKAASKVMVGLVKRVEEQMHRQIEPPDEIVSTVKV